LKKTAEDRIKALLAKHTFPPLEVIIPILEKSGRGEKELEGQIYETALALMKNAKKVLGMKGKDIRTFAKMYEVLLAADGTRIEPIELSESKFSFSITDCPMLHVKGVNIEVKSKFCDLNCNAATRAMTDAVLDVGRVKGSWDKALIKGGSRCTILFELVGNK
jgi:hypothetical protein